MNPSPNLFLVVVTQPGTPLRNQVECAGEVVAGRSEGCDIVLADDVVSRRHVSIRRNADRFVIRDLGSRNGTFLNGQQFIDEERESAFRATIQVGPFQLAVSLPESASDSTTVMAVPAVYTRCFLDTGLRQLHVDGKLAIEGVAGREYALLECLANAAPNVVPNQELADSIWGEGQWDVYMLHNLIRRVRRKIAEVTEDEVIVTVPGAGYRLL
jgi:DNA-binding response OmpR family regulator